MSNTKQPTAILVIVDTERTSFEVAKLALLNHLEDAGQAENREFTFFEVSLQADGLGANCEAQVELAKEQGIEQCMIVLAGKIDGNEFQRPTTPDEINEVLEAYSTALAMEGVLQTMEGFDK